MGAPLHFSIGGSPALSIERITALCSREIHPPVRAGQPLPGPGGEFPENPCSIIKILVYFVGGLRGEYEPEIC